MLISMFMYASYEVFYGYLLQTDQDKVHNLALYYSIGSDNMLFCDSYQTLKIKLLYFSCVR